MRSNDINQTPVNVPVSGNVLTNDYDLEGNSQTVTSALADTDGDGLVDDTAARGHGDADLRDATMRARWCLRARSR